jgi:hypothetical protein
LAPDSAPTPQAKGNAKMARKYHTLLLNEAPQGEGPQWAIQFGDYDRDNVEYERDEYLRDHPAKSLKIVTTGDKQADINAAVAKLNDWRGGAAS